jgi:D-alanyl-D-alanine carboxypeptidase/Putative Flp pilus-assembly TadE/G-like
VTFLVSGAGFLLCALVLGLTADLGATATSRARAQSAADAAALAAVAEAAPYGAGHPLQQAARFARLNGARLVDCRCEPGTTAVEVRVALGDVVADARATLDVELLAPQRATFDHAGLDPLLAESVERLVLAADEKVWVTSGYRSHAHQAELWAGALARYGDPEAADDWVAPPGHSMHERGLAVDLGGDLELAVEIIRRLSLPLDRPLANEPWHFELVGARR